MDIYVALDFLSVFIVTSWLAVVFLMPLGGLVGARFITRHKLTPAQRKLCGFSRVYTFHKSIMREGALAYSLWVCGVKVIVLDTKVILLGTKDQIAYIVAHELGHLTRGHCRERVLKIAIGLYKYAPHDHDRNEIEADKFAFEITGHADDIVNYGALGAMLRFERAKRK
jgi:Zn-dependent protease with chaperone function